MSVKVINIRGIIGWSVTPLDVQTQLEDAKGGPVQVRFASPGGFIAPGLDIFNLLRNYEGPIEGVLTGFAMSMASYIPLAIPLNVKGKGKLSAEDNAVYMIHNARGWAEGDHNEILRYGEYLKGLSGLISKAYARRTGKNVDEIRAMMDKETFLFGDEIMAHGFVDEIIAAEAEEEDKDQETALATARVQYEAMATQLKADQGAARADLQRAASMLGPMMGAFEPKPAVTPAAAGNNNTEVQHMKLVELLAAHPTAKTEYDTVISAARVEGETAGKKDAQARIDAAKPILSSTTYPAPVKEAAVKALSGELDVTALQTIVTTYDALKEQNAGSAAAGAAVPETPGQQGAVVVDPAATVKDEAGLNAAIDRAQKGGA